LRRPPRRSRSDGALHRERALRGVHEQPRSRPSQEISRREDLAPVFENLNAYETATHFNGQSTIVLNGARASGESYCLAHHVSLANGKRSLMVASIRYLDSFAKTNGRWRFSERQLMVDWIETRPLN
jgi:hypothetical protein